MPAIPPQITRFNAGDRHEIVFEADEALVGKFVGLTGDTNPLHLSDEFAASVGMGRRVVHGMAYASLISRLIGMHLPGPGALWMSQRMSWSTPVRIGDRLRLVGEVTEVSSAQRALTIKTEIFNQGGESVFSGVARVALPGQPAAAGAPGPAPSASAPAARGSTAGAGVALVTGATGGVGQAIAGELAKSGFDVALHFRRDGAAAEAVRGRLANACPGVRACALQADLSEPGAARRLVEGVTTQLGQPSVLVLNAGMRPAAVNFARLDWEQHVEPQLRVIVRSHLEIVQAALPAMNERRAGRIIGVLTNATRATPVPEWLPYIMAKSALESALKCLAAELGPHGVTVNGVLPGMMETAMTEDISARHKEALVRRTPTRRLTRPADVAELVAYLASPRAGQLNGCMISLDGGERIE